MRKLRPPNRAEVAGLLAIVAMALWMIKDLI